jgi:hypothetical protein
MDGQPWHVHAGGERSIARRQPARRGDADCARREVEPRPADVPPGSRNLEDGDGVAVPLGVFLDDDGVGAGRHRSAGEDADRFASAQHARVGAAGRCAADHAQCRRHRAHVGCAHGIAIHGRKIRRRLAQPGGHRPGEHTAARLRDRDRLRRQRCKGRDDAAMGVLDADHGVAWKVPDLPPDLCMRRTSPITMARSADLHMS